MARPKNPVPSREVRVSTTPAVVRYLDQLAATGLFGKNRAEAAERLIAQGIKQAITEGVLGPKSARGRGK